MIYEAFLITSKFFSLKTHLHPQGKPSVSITAHSNSTVQPHDFLKFQIQLYLGRKPSELLLSLGSKQETLLIRVMFLKVNSVVDRLKDFQRQSLREKVLRRVLREMPAATTDNLPGLHPGSLAGG